MRSSCNVVLFLLLTFFAAPAWSSPEVEAAIRSVWRIRGESTHACGTGFSVGPNRIVTTAHLARSLCPFTKCRGIFFEQSARIGALPKTSQSLSGVDLVLLLESMDVAVLQLPEVLQFEEGGLTLAQPADLDKEVFSLSYSGCSSLQIHQGKLVGAIGPWLETSLSIKHGASGAPVFLRSGALIGMIEQASSLFGALGGILVDKPFSARAITLRPSLFDQKPEVLLNTLVIDLLSYYEQYITRLTGSARAWEGLEYYSVVNQIKDDLARLSPKELGPVYLQLGAKVDSFRLMSAEDSSEAKQNSTALVLSANLERNGLRGSSFSRVSIQELKTYVLQGLAESSVEHGLVRVLDAYGNRDGDGFYFALLRSASIFFLTILCVLVLWGISIGYIVRETSNQSLLKRCILITCVSFLFWPISLVIYWLTKRKTLS